MSGPLTHFPFLNDLSLQGYGTTGQTASSGYGTSYGADTSGNGSYGASNTAATGYGGTTGVADQGGYGAYRGGGAPSQSRQDRSYRPY